MRRRATVLFVLYLALALGVWATLTLLASDYIEDVRGIESGPRAAPLRLGVNVDLEQYDAAGLDRSLGLIQGARLELVRQTFPWREIEPRPGEFHWERWDRIVAAARGRGLEILPVLNTTPAWAQREYERENPFAPPDDFGDLARFATVFVSRYHLGQYEIWDQPNVYPNWGERNANPAEYDRLLKAAGGAIRAAEPGARIVLAGLAMNTEKEHDRRTYAETLFLRALYEMGAREDFDVVAAKPYGLWSGPDDRRVSLDVLNFSRLVLLHEEMAAHSDTRPLVAVESGWDALPANWAGDVSPWGSDDEAKQAGRLAQAIGRARDEWPWLGLIYVETFQPAAPGSDPRWGLALVDAAMQPREFYRRLAALNASPLTPQPIDHTPFFIGTTLLAGAALVASWRGLCAARQTPFRAGWQGLRERFRALPEEGQLAVLAAAVGAFYLAPYTDLSVLLLVLLVPLFALRLDLGLALTVFTIPFFLLPKTIFTGFSLSLVEVLTLVSLAALGLDRLLRAGAFPSEQLARQVGLAGRIRARVVSLSALDWGVALLVVAGIISLRAASNFGVANRELRVVVIEPALFYFLVRAARPEPRKLLRLMRALLASGLAIAAIGLYQYLFTTDVIVAEGTSRIHAVWGSPNNAALYLGRVIPVALVFALLNTSRVEKSRAVERAAYALAAAALLVVLYLTYSRGALFFGIPASLLFIALLAGAHTPRARWVVAGLLGLGALALIPFALTGRFQSFFQEGTGTGFFRVAVWTSALQMIRDHPVWGVGLDNFLYEYPKYMLPEAWREPNLSHPHQLILDWWTRLGILGVVALAWLQAAFFRRGLAVYRGSEPLARALALAAMASMVDFLAHGTIDAGFFLVDLAYVFMLCAGVIGTLGKESTDASI